MNIPVKSQDVRVEDRVRVKPYRARKTVQRTVIETSHTDQFANYRLDTGEWQCYVHNVSIGVERDDCYEAQQEED